MAVRDVQTLKRKIVAPVEDVYHIYPVLLLPTDKSGEAIVLGLRKARAIVKHYREIVAFLERHPE